MGVVGGAVTVATKKNKQNAQSSPTEWATTKTPLIWALAIVYILLVKFYPHRVPVIRHGLLPQWYYLVGIVQLALSVAFIPALGIIVTDGWTASVCQRGNLYDGWWTGTVVLLFVISKIVDLAETMLIMTEGRNPLDLHVFHHTVTLVYVWHSYTQQSSMARWFIITNLLSHALLYAYLSPKKIANIRPCWLSVAIAQIVALFICLVATITAQRHLAAGGQCDVDSYRLSLDKLVIVIFLIIFADFYHQKCREFRRKEARDGKLLARSSQRPRRQQEDAASCKCKEGQCGIVATVKTQVEEPQ